MSSSKKPPSGVFLVSGKEAIGADYAALFQQRVAQAQGAAAKNADAARLKQGVHTVVVEILHCPIYAFMCNIYMNKNKYKQMNKYIYIYIRINTYMHIYMYILCIYTLDVYIHILCYTAVIPGVLVHEGMQDLRPQQ